MLGTVPCSAGWGLMLYCAEHRREEGGLGGLRKPLGREVATTAFYSTPTHPYTALMHTVFARKLATTNPLVLPSLTLVHCNNAL